MITTILVEFPSGDEIIGRVSIVSLPDYVAIEALQRHYPSLGIMIGTHQALCCVVVFDQQPVAEIFACLEEILPEYVLGLPIEMIESLNFEQNIVKFTG